MPLEFKKTIELFEFLSLDDGAFYIFQNQDNTKVCVQYSKKSSKQNWSIWYQDFEKNSKQTLTSRQLSETLQAFKVDEQLLVVNISNTLLLQAAYADEFIRQIKQFFGVEAVQKCILETQNFMEEMTQSVDQLFHNDSCQDNDLKDSSAKAKGDRIGLRVIK